MAADLLNRHENILVLPYNMTRIIDLCLQLEIMAAKELPIKNIEDVLFLIINRAEKDLAKLNKVDPEVMKKILDASIVEYYKIAPRTNICKMLNIFSNQKFVDRIIYLFDNKSVSDPAYMNAYYDGTIEELEKFIVDNNITAIYMHDVELLRELVLRNKISLHNMTIMLGAYGYNLIEGSSKGEYFMKYYGELSKIYKERGWHVETAIFKVYDFSDETIMKFRRNNDNGNE